MEYETLNESDATVWSTPFVHVMGQGDVRERNRVILSKAEADSISPDGSFEYGEYPQSIIENNESDKKFYGLTAKELEQAFHRKLLKETGKEYTVLTGQAELKRIKEYEYNGKKFVRVSPAADVRVDSVFVNVKAHSPVWFAVDPIVWNRTEQGTAEADWNLFPGRCFDQANPRYISKAGWQPKFDDWFNSTFVKDMMPWNAVAVDSMERAPAKRKRRGFGVSFDDAPMSVKEQIAFYISTGKSFMLHGPSGCGKTRRIHDIDPNFTAVPFVKGCLPEQIIGKVCYPNGKMLSPIDKDGKAVDLPNGGVWMPPEWYVDLCKKCKAEPTKMHVVFIDEVTNGSESSQSLLFQIVERKSVTGSHGKLPANSVVVLAGNSKEESSAAYNMPEPLFRRAHGHIYLKPNIADWLEWGSQKSTSHPDEEGRLNVHPLVAAFVATYGKDCFYTEFDEEEPKQTMDPRGWEQVSDIIYDNKGGLRKELLENKMGKELAATFYEFNKNPPLTAADVLEIVSENKTGITDDDIRGISIPQRPDEKLALVYGLRQVDERHVGQVRSFIHRCLKAEYCAVFDKVWCEGKPERAIFLKRLDDKMNGGFSR